jgi:hypothetical protein
VNLEYATGVVEYLFPYNRPAKSPEVPFISEAHTTFRLSCSTTGMPRCTHMFASDVAASSADPEK